MLDLVWTNFSPTKKFNQFLSQMFPRPAPSSLFAWVTPCHIKTRLCKLLCFELKYTTSRSVLWLTIWNLYLNHSREHSPSTVWYIEKKHLEKCKIEVVKFGNLILFHECPSQFYTLLLSCTAAINCRAIRGSGGSSSHCLHLDRGPTKPSLFSLAGFLCWHKCVHWSCRPCASLTAATRPASLHIFERTSP